MHEWVTGRRFVRQSPDRCLRAVDLKKGAAVHTRRAVTLTAGFGGGAEAERGRVASSLDEGGRITLARECRQESSRFIALRLQPVIGRRIHPVTAAVRVD